MSSDGTAAPHGRSAIDFDHALGELMRRLTEIVRENPLTEDSFVEMLTIYNNASYVFIYLDSNEDYVNFHRMSSWRDAFYDDPVLLRRIMTGLRTLTCSDDGAEHARRRYLRQLGDKVADQGPVPGADPAGPVSMLESALDRVRDDQAELLRRIGWRGGGNPEAVCYRLVREQENPVVRRKLAAAWSALPRRRRAELLEPVDRMVEARRLRSARAGYPTPLAWTLSRCTVTEDVVAAFLASFLDEAVADYTALEAQVGSTLGITDDPMSHFPVFLREMFGDVPAPVLPFEECLDYIFAVTRAVFGLSVRRLPADRGDGVPVAVSDGIGEVGRALFDRWPRNQPGNGATGTFRVGGRVGPMAYVCAKVRPDEHGVDHIAFPDAHMLFHEFGHALNHLLVRHRMVDHFGFEYVPLERVEQFSTWFEKWSYHPDFASSLSLSGDDRDRLEKCQQVRLVEYRRAYVERATLAALDFDVNRRGSGGLEQSFQELDERFGLSRYCALEDFPRYFAWPALAANPGAYFMYLFGSAYAGERFRRFQHIGLAEIAGGPSAWDAFSSCFSFQEPTDIPDVRSAFEFYDLAWERSVATR